MSLYNFIVVLHSKWLFLGIYEAWPTQPTFPFTCRVRAPTCGLVCAYPCYPHTSVRDEFVWLDPGRAALIISVDELQSGGSAELREGMRPSKKETEGERADRGTIMRGEARTPQNSISKEQKTKVSQNQQIGGGGGWKTEATRSAEFLL